MGLRELPVQKPFRDLGQIQLVASEMRSHPDPADALRLSATIVNRASRSQAYPGLEVILLDLKGQALASRQFEPSEYLARGSRHRRWHDPRSLPSGRSGYGRPRSAGSRLRIEYSVTNQTCQMACIVVGLELPR